MPYLVVSPLSRIAEAAVAHAARDMVSLMGADHEFHRPAVIDHNRHLTIGVNDIVAEQNGLIAPQETHVARLLSYTGAWDRANPLLIHCWMGISRSPAAALIVALGLEPDQDDDLLARRLRSVSPFSTPNARMIAIADVMLKRNGRLVRAVHAIGRGADAFEGRPFSLAVRPDDPVPQPALPLATDD